MNRSRISLKRGRTTSTSGESPSSLFRRLCFGGSLISLLFIVGVSKNQGAIFYLSDYYQKASQKHEKGVDKTSPGMSKFNSTLFAAHAQEKQNNKSSTQRSSNSSIIPASQVQQRVKNRTILLVHVGKCGGLTLRRSTAGTRCNPGPSDQYNATRVDACIERKFSKDQVLARQTRFVFHVSDYSPNITQQATSFLFTIRNPVDRIISAYRYSHPGNCLPEIKRKPGPGGCFMAHSKFMKDPESLAYKTYVTCFPSAAMEHFAQSVMGPYPNYTENDESSTPLQHNKTVQEECQALARSMAKGDVDFVSPHMRFNYGWYAHKTMDIYPEKEVLAIRTTHGDTDKVALDKFLGGNGKFKFEGKLITHGSEEYIPSPLSTQAYQKLCCVLHEEIDIYLGILRRAVNLDATEKQNTIESLRDKCGVVEPWQEWKSKCKIKLLL